MATRKFHCWHPPNDASSQQQEKRGASLGISLYDCPVSPEGRRRFRAARTVDKGHTILLIDSEPEGVPQFTGPLAAAGYTVEVASSGKAGLEAFVRLEPALVLVDASLPIKHGFEVCQDLKRTDHGQRTPVIITTSVYKGADYRTFALQVYRCDEFLEKPVTAERLLEVVNGFLGPAPVGDSTAVRVSRSAAATASEFAAHGRTASPAPAGTTTLEPPPGIAASEMAAAKRRSEAPIGEPNARTLPSDQAPIPPVLASTPARSDNIPAKASVPRRRGAPGWLWAAAVVVTGVGSYLVVVKRGAAPGVATLPIVHRATTSTSVAAPAPAPAASAALAPSASQPAKTTSRPAKPLPPPKVRRAPVPATSALVYRPPTAPQTSGPPAPSPVPATTSDPSPSEKPAAVEPTTGPATAASSAPPATATGALDGAATIAPGTLIPIDEADLVPVRVQSPPPVYSDAAKQLGLHGTVFMNVLVNERGTVDNVVLVSGISGADVNDSAMRAARTWLYRPALKQGVPVKVWTSERIEF